MYEELKVRLDDAWTTTSPREHIEFMVSCLESIEQLERQLEHQLEEARMNYLGAMTDCGNLERQLAERDAEIAKYRDAPVVAYRFDKGPITKLDTWPHGGNWKPLIVKPGEQ